MRSNLGKDGRSSYTRIILRQKPLHQILFTPQKDQKKSQTTPTTPKTPKNAITQKTAKLPKRKHSNQRNHLPKHRTKTPKRKGQWFALSTTCLLLLGLGETWQNLARQSHYFGTSWGHGWGVVARGVWGHKSHTFNDRPCIFGLVPDGRICKISAGQGNFFTPVPSLDRQNILDVFPFSICVGCSRHAYRSQPNGMPLTLHL